MSRHDVTWRDTTWHDVINWHITYCVLDTLYVMMSYTWYVIVLISLVKRQKSRSLLHTLDVKKNFKVATNIWTATTLPATIQRNMLVKTRQTQWEDRYQHDSRFVINVTNKRTTYPFYWHRKSVENHTNPLINLFLLH